MDVGWRWQPEPEREKKKKRIYTFHMTWALIFSPCCKQRHQDQHIIQEIVLTEVINLCYLCSTAYEKSECITFTCSVFGIAVLMFCIPSQCRVSFLLCAALEHNSVQQNNRSRPSFPGVHTSQEQNSVSIVSEFRLNHCKFIHQYSLNSIWIQLFLSLLHPNFVDPVIQLSFQPSGLKRDFSTFPTFSDF